MTDKRLAVELHRWAEDNCPDPEVQGALARGLDCPGLILEYLLRGVGEYLDGHRSELLRPGTESRLVKAKVRRDPTLASIALSDAVAAAMIRWLMVPSSFGVEAKGGEILRMEFTDGSARTGCMVVVKLKGTGIERRLVVFAEE